MNSGATPNPSAQGGKTVPRPRRLGQGSAKHRYERMAAGHSLPGHKQEMLRLTSRLLIHAINASNRLYHDTEVTAEGEPRQLLGRLLELGREIRANLNYCFDREDQGDDPFASLRGEK